MGVRWQHIWLMASIFLASCTTANRPLSDDLALNPIVQPPWDALVKATPGAENDLDLETLDGPQQAATPSLASPPLQVSEKKSEPKKGAITIRYVAVPQVTGAPGAGNKELTKAMRQVLRDAGWPVLNAPRADAITLQGRVTISAAQGGNQQVKVVWEALPPKGQSLGEVKQDNAVPAGSLDKSWGKDADYVSQAAAEGIFKLIQGYR